MTQMSRDGRMLFCNVAQQLAGYPGTSLSSSSSGIKKPGDKPGSKINNPKLSFFVLKDFLQYFGFEFPYVLFVEVDRWLPVLLVSVAGNIHLINTVSECQ